MTAALDMDCPDANQLSAFTGGLLPPARVATVLEHLARCQRCGSLVALLSEGEEVAPPPPDAEGLLPQATSGRYTFTGELGQGGMGVVYAAHDALLDRDVAIKVVRGRGEDTLALATQGVRLVQEAKTLARLNHPNVVRVYDAGLLDGRFFIAMELVTGQSLRAWLRQRAWPWRSVVAVFIQAGKGLAAAHAAQVIHRDFKPDNVLVDTQGHVRVTDFGLATLQQDGPPGPRTPLAGTRAYLAPELWAGQPADEKSDQYAFAVTLFEALAGNLPQGGQGSTRNVPRALRAILKQALQAAPSARFESLEALVTRLERAISPPRYVGLAVAAAVLATSCVVGVLGWNQVQMRRCQGAAQELGLVWSAARAATVQGAFAATGMPYAATTWQTVQATLTTYAQRWQAERLRYCPRTVLEGGGGGAAVLGVRCLDRRKAELDALVTVLEHADRDVLDHAVQAAHSLTPAQRCLELDEPLGQRMPLPTQTLRKVEALQTQAAAIKALLDTGQATKAVQPATALLAQADVDHPSFLAELQLLVGSVHLDAGAYDAAEQLLWTALFTAEAGTNHAVRLRALMRLAMLASNARRDQSQAATLTRMADALMHKTNAGAELRAELVGMQAQLAFYDGRTEDALPLAEQALYLAEAAFGPTAPTTWWQRSLLAWVNKDLLRLDVALALAQRSLADRTAALGADHPETAKGLYNLAAIHLDGGAYDLAIQQLDAAVDLVRRTLGTQHLLALRFQAAHAEALGRAGRHAQADAELTAVLPLMERVAGKDNARVGEVLLTHGHTLLALGRVGQAQVVLERALTILETGLSAGHPWLAPVHVELGWARLRQGAPKDAEARAQKALTLLGPHLGHPRDRFQAFFLLASALAVAGAPCPRVEEAAAAAQCVLPSGGPVLAAQRDALAAWKATQRRCVPAGAASRLCP